MPYTPTTPTLLLCQGLAAAVSAAWNPQSPDAVDWAYFVRYADADPIAVPTLTGRQVRFFPASYDREPETRALNRYAHHVQCLVVERYTDAAGDVPRDWVSARVDFVHAQIVKALWFGEQNGPATWNPFLQTLGSSVTVYDPEKLVSGSRLFYAMVELEFSELVTP